LPLSVEAKQKYPETPDSTYWPQAAGPHGSWGTQTDGKVPTSFNVAEGRNILWKKSLDESGQSGIAVWKDRLFLTVMEPIIKNLKRFKVKTLTFDNGLRFAEHGRVSKALGAKGYFCNPYHSWEKGGVENYNGLVRQYYPKGSSFESISSSTLRRVEDEINPPEENT
jgi:hypothetical protein